MNYYYDTEFLEGTQTIKGWFGFPIVQTEPTIDLISIGIVSEDGREYYAISKDFNLKEAWNRYDIKVEPVSGDMRNHYPEGIETKVYWIRDNVLKPIHNELAEKEDTFCHGEDGFFTYQSLKRLINKYGKSNKQIAQEVKLFITQDGVGTLKGTQKLYGYYSAYDHVVFCWLFGKMLNLPKGFPMYTIDLKQELDRIQDKYKQNGIDFSLKEDSNVAQQANEHNALADAKWNKALHNFLKTIKYES